MADPIIKIKRSSVANKVPTPDNLELGELAINTNDAKVYLEQQAGITTVVCINPWNVGLGSLSYDIYFNAGNVGIGTELATQLLDVNGTSRLRGGLYDANNSVGTDTYVLTSTGAGVSWAAASGGASAINDLTDVTITSATQDDILRYTGSAWINDAQINLSGVGTFSEVKSSQLNVTGVTTFQNNVNLLAGDELNIGNSGELQFRTSGIYSYIKYSGTGGLIVNTDFIVYKNAADTENISRYFADGACEFYFNGNEKLATTNTGVNITGTAVCDGLSVTGNSNVLDVYLPDNEYVFWGTGNDLYIGHDGSNSYIADVGVGDLYIANNNSVFITNQTFTENKAVFTSDGSVDLYHNNVKKIETTSAGVLVSGQTTTTTLNVTGVSTFGGNMYIDAGLYDINDSLGTDTYVLTSTGAGVSWAAASGGTPGISTQKYISTYGSGSQTNTTEITVDLDTTGESSGTGDFTVSAAGVITVVNAGLYLIQYSVTTDISSGTSRSGTYAYVRLDGSGEVTASRSYMYNRNTANGENTGSKQFVMDLAANATLEIRSGRYAGSDTTVVRLDYSRFTIVSLEYEVLSGGGGGGASALNDLTDVTLSSPTTGQVLKYNGSVWVNDTDSTGGGGSGDGGTFNTGITTSLYHSVTSGIGANSTEDNNIFIGPGVAYTFPATAGRRYLVESIQLSNITTQDAYVVARHDFNGFTDVPMAQRVIVPYRGALELLEHPIVFNPSDELRLQAMDGLASTANGLSNAVDAFIVWTEKSDTAYIGTGATITTSDQSIYTASSQTVIETVSISNFSLTADRNVSVSIFRGVSRLGYLCKELTIPKNSVIDVIEKPKYLAIGDKIAVNVLSGEDQVSCRIAGKTY